MNRLYNEATIERFEAITGERPDTSSPDDMELLWEIAADLAEEAEAARPARVVQRFELRMHSYYFGSAIADGGPFGDVASTVYRTTSEVIG